jgi:hypothetical protein
MPDISESDDLIVEPDEQLPTPPITAVSGKKQRGWNLKPYQFKPGESGNPKGRPPGTFSPITMIRKYFEDNPEDASLFVMDYMQNPYNSKHIIEMLDGRPAQRVTVAGDAELPFTIIIKRDEREGGETV